MGLANETLGGHRPCFRWAVLSVGLFILPLQPLFAQYNRQAALVYMSSWAYTSSQEPDSTAGVADQVNTPRFTWHYYTPQVISTGRLARIQNVIQKKILSPPLRTSDGGQGIPIIWGFDCANFISQVLLAGGVDLAGGDFSGSPPQPIDPIAKGGTYISVARLAAVPMGELGSTHRFTLGARF
jgi:hypothetical protein